MNNTRKEFIDILSSATPAELNELVLIKGKYKPKSMCYILRKELQNGTEQNRNRKDN